MLRCPYQSTSMKFILDTALLSVALTWPLDSQISNKKNNLYSILMSNTSLINNVQFTKDGINYFNITKVTVCWKFGHCSFLHNCLDAQYSNYALSIIFILKKFVQKQEKSRKTMFVSPLFILPFNFMKLQTKEEPEKDKSSLHLCTILLKCLITY